MSVISISQLVTFSTKEKRDILSLYRKGKTMKQIKHLHRAVTKEMVDMWLMEFPEGI